ncbi:MAG: peptidoglycan endopeptidase [Mycobacterium sp.]
MYAVAALLSLISQVAGTPYISGGDTPAGTDCSGLASWVANVASGRPAFGSRFNTGNIEPALLARGFHYGTAPNSVVIGWNGGHAAVTLPDGTPVSSGESGSGVRIGGGGAFQPQFNHHMYLPVQADTMNTDPAAPPASGDVAGDVVIIDIANTETHTTIATDIATDPVASDPAASDPVVSDPAALPAVAVEAEAEQVPA